MNKLLPLLLIVLICSCTKSTQRKGEDSAHDEFILASWVHQNGDFDAKQWEDRLNKYDSLGIKEILVRGEKASLMQQIVNAAAAHNIKVHAWMWTLNRPGDTIANKHPEWYSVNKLGQNSLEHRPYVDYYQWLSPFVPEAREHIKNNVRELVQVQNLASIHLDYVRYVDVILGAALQPKYGLKQNTQMPQFDYGYHPIAREQYETLFGTDPMTMEHPELSTEWLQFRLNAVTSLVNECAALAHQNGQRITAAVFPFPEMSRQMVRQSWDEWPLDAAYPMLYQNFYNQNVHWIGFSTQQGVRSAAFPIYAGLYTPAFHRVDDFQLAIQEAQDNGAKGVAIFTVDDLPKEYEQVLLELKHR